MGAAAYVAAVLADTPVAFWECQDSSGLPVDSSGNGLNMTASGGTPVYQQQGPFTSDYAIRLADAYYTRPAVTTATDNFTMECWVSPLAEGTYGGGLIRNATSGGLDGWVTVTNTGGKFLCVAENVAVLATSANQLVSQQAQSSWSMPLLGVGGSGSRAWNYVVTQRSSGTWVYYFNGAVDTANAGTAGPITPGGSALAGFSDSTFTWDARFAYVAIYNTALSGTRVAAHYTAGLS